MFDWIRQRVLAGLRVPHDPAPPFGAPGSVRVFRAGRNYYNLRLFRWCLGQSGAVIGIVISLTFLGWFKQEVDSARLARAQAAAAAPIPAPSSPPPAASSPVPARKAPRTRVDPRVGLRNGFKLQAARTPGWVIPVIEFFEIFGIMTFLVQLPISFAAVRLDYEMHWYIVTDRSLRIRTGLVRLQESTMSFANLQQVEVKQGPLQRLLGLADVHVQSAGGGEREHGQVGDSLHTGIFHSVNNANEIRDLILDRLRQFRQAGLGDPDDHHAHPLAPPEVVATEDDTLTAAHEVLAEVRALRQALARV